VYYNTATDDRNNEEIEKTLTRWVVQREERMKEKLWNPSTSTPDTSESSTPDPETSTAD
jgi:hypothetical protein